jgi:hypothetical protein
VTIFKPAGKAAALGEYSSKERRVFVYNRSFGGMITVTDPG